MGNVRVVAPEMRSTKQQCVRAIVTARRCSSLEDCDDNYYAFTYSVSIATVIITKPLFTDGCQLIY